MERAVPQLTPSELSSLNRERAANGALDLEISHRLGSFPRAIRPLLLSHLFESVSYSTFAFLGLCYIHPSNVLTRGHPAVLQVGLDPLILVALWWLSSFVGATVSDSYIGKLRTISLFSVIWLIGGLLLIAFTLLTAPLTPQLFILPALLLILGASAVAPCRLALGGDQFIAFQSRLTDKYFSLFYAASVLGSFIAHAVWPYIPALVARIGLGMVCLLISLLVMLLFSKRYRFVPPPKRLLSWRVLWLILLATHRWLRAKPQQTMHWLEFGGRPFSQEFITETRLLIKVWVCAMPIVLFWMLHSHILSDWLEVELNLTPDHFTMDRFSINLVATVGFIPILSFYVYPMLERCGTQVPVMRRIIWGYLVLLASALLAKLILVISPSSRETYLVIQILLPLSQAIITPSLDLFAYSQSGRQLKTVSSSLILFTSALGNIIATSIKQSLPSTLAAYLTWIYLFIATLGFLVLICLANCWYVSIEDEEIQDEIRKLIRKSNSLWFL